VSRVADPPILSRIGPRLREPVVVPAPPVSGTKSRHRKARRAVLWGAAALVLANLGLAAALETVCPQLRDPEYGYRLVRARAQQKHHPDRPLVLVLGTSRTAYGVDPTEMGFPDRVGSPVVFNFGLSGSGPVHLRLHLQRLRTDGVKPAAVLVELFPVVLAETRSADTLFGSEAARLTAGDLRRLEPQLADPGALCRHWAAARLNPWQAQRVVLVSHLAPGLLPWAQRLDHHWTMTDDRGFCPYPMTKIEELRESRTAAMRAQYAPVLRAVRPSESSTRALRELVADCRSAGIPVAFFLTPESPAFRNWYAPESRAVVEAYTRALSEELNCPVFAAPDDFGEEDFADGHHMLRPAAARYSRWLADTRLRPWLAEVLK
jgi:hypothetical protein